MKKIQFLIALTLLASCATPPLALDVYKLRLKEVFKKYEAVASLKSSSSTSPFSFGGSVTPVSAASSSPASSSVVSAEKARKDSDYKSLKESSKGSLEAINAVQSDLNSITPSVGLEEKHKAIKQMFESIKSYQEEINGLPSLRSELKEALDNGRINNLKTKQAASLKATLEGSKALDDIGILGESSFSGGVDQSRLALLLVDPKKLDIELEASAQSAVNSLVELGKDPLPPVLKPATLTVPFTTLPPNTQSVVAKLDLVVPGSPPQKPTDDDELDYQVPGSGCQQNKCTLNIDEGKRVFFESLDPGNYILTAYARNKRLGGIADILAIKQIPITIQTGDNTMALALEALSKNAPLPAASPTPAPTAQPTSFPTTVATRTPAPTATAAATATVTVKIEGFKFVPKNLTIKAGTTVTWINEDSAPHTASSLSGAETFDTEIISKGTSKSYTFTTVGKTQYQCNFHPGMMGSVTVEATATTPAT